MTRSEILGYVVTLKNRFLDFTLVNSNPQLWEMIPCPSSLRHVSEISFTDGY